MDFTDKDTLFKISGNNKVSPSIAVEIPPRESEEPYLYIRWTKLTYMIPSRSRGLFCPLRRPKSEDVILKGLTGEIKNGVLLAIMGPSGCGKSTLLHCLSGQRRTGLMGEIYCSKGEKIRAAFITQEDHLLGQLTVKESLLFSSKIKNHFDFRHKTEREKTLLAGLIADDKQGRPTTSDIHRSMVEKTLEQLGLSECANTRVSSCSGGQRKRLSIASELISRPDLMILDEPTSGLDSSSCSQCIQLLAKLANPSVDNIHAQPLAIIASIHQPSAKVLFMFHQLYILSRDGQCIYRGSPQNLVETLSRIGLNCPTFHNPGDFVIEVATGDYGVEAIMKLVSLQHFSSKLDETPYFDLSNVEPNYSIIGWKKTSQRSFAFYTWLLLKRNFVVSLREPMLMTLRLVTYLSVGAAVSLLYGSEIGKADGCHQLYWTPNEADAAEKLVKANENISFLFFSLLFHLFAAMMPTVLTFPLEMSVFLKEHNNEWYSCSSYYIAKFLADTPFQIIFPLIYCSISYFMTGQIVSSWRFSLFTIICCLISMLSQSIGLLIGAFCVHDVNQAVFIAPITAIPVLLFCGFFVRTGAMSWWVKLLSYCSYMKFAFEAMVAGIYGFNRCVLNLPRPGRPMPLEREYLSHQTGDQIKISLIHSAIIKERVEHFYWKFSCLAASLAIFQLSCSHRVGHWLDVLKSNFQINFTDNGLQDWEFVNTTYPPAFDPDDYEPTNPSLASFSDSSWNGNEKGSFVMRQFDLDDSLVFKNILALIGFIIFYRTVTYFVFLYRAKQKL